MAVSDAREVRLFRNNRNQAVRIPVDLELPGDRALLRKEGDRLILEPVRPKGLIALLSGWEPIDEAFPDVADPKPQPEDVFE